MTAEVRPVAAAPTWWRRTGLDVVDHRLSVNGADLESLLAEHGAPLFVYDLERPRENVRALQGALRRAGVDHVVRFALKACPDPRILAVLRGLGEPGAEDSVGIDACSPGEVTHALANGWEPGEISHTGTNVSERDLDVLLAHPIRINLDGVSQLERLGRRAPGRRVGIRINPGAGAGYTEHLAYAGDRPTKFGVSEDRLDDAIEACRRHGLVVDTLHFHAGSGWLGDQLDGFERALGRATRFLDRLTDAGFAIREVNVGGGLGVPARQDEDAVDLDAYAEVVARHLGPYGVVAAFEPGDYVMKDAAVLLGEVVSVERRGDTTFVGLDIGWNVNCSYFIYRYAQEILPVRDPIRPRTQRVTVAGHINEAGDVFAEDYPFPDVAEGEPVAILNAGGYLQAMSSTHCLRPMGTAVYVEREGGSVIEPEVEGYVRVEGGRLWAEWAGEGSGVVLAHAGIADARQWDPQWDALIAGHRVVRYDLRGFGRAEVEHVRFSNRADLIAVMDAAGIERAVLVGCSRAGSIVVDTALESPDRVSGVVHVCGGISGTDWESTPVEEAEFAKGEALEEAKDWAALADQAVRIWVDGFGQPEGRAPAGAREAVRRMAYESSIQDKPYGDPIVLDPPAAGRLGELSMPVLVIQGLLDESGTIQSGRLLAAQAPKARLIELPDVAHMPNLEKPEWFTETLLAFLAEVDAG